MNQIQEDKTPKICPTCRIMPTNVPHTCFGFAPAVTPTGVEEVRKNALIEAITTVTGYYEVNTSIDGVEKEIMGKLESFIDSLTQAAKEEERERIEGIVKLHLWNHGCDSEPIVRWSKVQEALYKSELDQPEWYTKTPKTMPTLDDSGLVDGEMFIKEDGLKKQIGA